MGRWSKRDLLTYLARVLPVLDSSDHFELLDVSPDADEKAIQSAFHNMAGGLHPDRHRNSLSPEQHESLVIVYGRIAEAYRVLRDADNRDTYLRNVAHRRKKKPQRTDTQSQSVDSALALLSPKAQRLYRRAMASKRTGDLASANLNLRMALAKHPQSGFLKEALASLQKL